MTSKRLLGCLLFAAAVAGHAQTAPVSVERAWLRATVQGQTTTGAYMTLTAREPLVLTGVSSPAAGVVEIHEMRMDGDIMRMRAVENLPLGPGKPLELKPGGYHVMLTQLRMRLQPSASVPLTLQFRTSSGEVSELRLSIPVRTMAPSS